MASDGRLPLRPHVVFPLGALASLGVPSLLPRAPVDGIRVATSRPHLMTSLKTRLQVQSRWAPGLQHLGSLTRDGRQTEVLTSLEEWPVYLCFSRFTYLLP